MDEWNAWRTLQKKELGEQKSLKSQTTSEEKEEIEVWVDEVIEQIEEEVVE